MSEFIETPHFHDLIDTPHLINDAERLPGKDGKPGTGLTLKEAVPLAELWWDTKARFSMPDFGKDPHEQIMKSGVLMGLPWFNLGKKEMLRVLAQWYAHVGVHLIVEGKSTSQDDSQAQIMDDLRDSSKEIFEVMDTSSTHTETARGDNDSKEVETWQKEYEDLENEEQILDAQGDKLTSKGN